MRRLEFCTAKFNISGKQREFGAVVLFDTQMSMRRESRYRVTISARCKIDQ